MSGAAFAALAAARWIHFASVMLLFGASWFPFYALTRASPSPALAGARGALRGAAIIAAASGLAWAAASLVTITGEFDSLFDGDALAAFLLDTGFGRIWLLRLVLLSAMLLAVLTAGSNVPARNPATALIASMAALLLVSQAWIGHPAASPGMQRMIVIGGYGLHVLGAGAWLGGLLPLLLILRGADADGAQDRSVEFALRRFSTLGMFAIAMILAGGLINAWARWNSLDALLASSWGRVLILKAVGFAALVTLAALNRFVLMPRLAANGFVRTQLTRNVVAEQAGGVLILAAAAYLGILPPPA